MAADLTPAKKGFIRDFAENNEQWLIATKKALAKFKAQNGVGGKWIAEYQKLEDDGILTPQKTIDAFCDMLRGESSLNFQARDAIRHIMLWANQFLYNDNKKQNP